MSLKFLASAILLGALGAPLFAASHSEPQAAPSISHKGKNQTTAANSSQQHGDEGQRIFEQNCARCHNAPEGFSPSITGTIVRHMRVRASLSQHEEEELLRFFNP